MLNKTRQDHDSDFQKWADEFDMGKAFPICGTPENSSKYGNQNSSNPFGWLKDLWATMLT